MPDAITLLTQACDPTESLEADDPRYVNLDDVRGENFVLGYARTIRRSDPYRPVVSLFAGHRGVGKTCELRRLQHHLVHPKRFSSDKPFLVIYVDVDPVAVDLNDLDWPDLLIHISSRVVQDLQSSGIAGFGKISQYMRDRFDELKGALRAQVSIPAAELGTELASLSIELRNRPTSRKMLREAIERHGTGIQQALDDMLVEANRELIENNDKAGLVLMVDGLERMPRRTLEGEGIDSHERLFIRRCTQWSSLKAHMVMTIPISLLYTSGFAEVNQNLGQSTRPVPMVRTHESNESTADPDHPGMKKLVELIEKRCRFAHTSIEAAFDSLETVHYLCAQSGGHPRNLLIFLTSAMLLIDSLPITMKVAERAVRNEANSLVRGMPDEYWQHLRRFENPTKECPSDDEHRTMLFLLHVFEYMNGEAWWQVNPILRAHPKFDRVD